MMVFFFFLPRAERAEAETVARAVVAREAC